MLVFEGISSLFADEAWPGSPDSTFKSRILHQGNRYKQVVKVDTSNIRLRVL